MEPCTDCTEQMKKTRNGKPHGGLAPLGEKRLFRGSGTRGFEEQDYQCLTCQARFTRSTDKNDLAWTLWRG